MIQGLYAGQFVDELLRIMSDLAGWPSTLTRQSTIGLMEELAEAGAQTVSGVLSPSSFEDLKAQVREQLLNDPGVGKMQARGPLLSQIPRDSKEFVPSSFKYKSWTFALPALKRNYIHNWREELKGPQYSDTASPAFAHALAPYETACFVASHLLHLGFSTSYLSRWISYRARRASSIYNTDDFFEDLENLIRTARGRVRILVALAHQPPGQVQSLQGWMDGKSARQWLKDHGFHDPRSIHGGILFDSEQWDVDGALENVAKAMYRLRQRTILKTGKAAEFHSTAWVAGMKSPRRLPEISQLRRTLAPGYELSDPQVEAPTSDDRLEVSVELLLTGLSEPGASAAGTLWAALEALLAAPGDPDRIQVANRAGDIALVTLVRASIQMSLGLLFSRCPQEPLTQRLIGLELGERLVEFEDALRRGEHMSLPHRSTRLACSYTKQLFDVDILRRKREEVRQTFKGLYRQRNLILHGGITDAPLLDGILRASTPLVSAVVNRYAMANHDGLVDPHIFAYEMFVRLESYLNDPHAIVSNIW